MVTFNTKAEFRQNNFRFNMCWQLFVKLLSAVEISFNFFSSAVLQCELIASEASQRFESIAPCLLLDGFLSQHRGNKILCKLMFGLFVVFELCELCSCAAAAARISDKVSSLPRTG